MERQITHKKILVLLGSGDQHGGLLEVIRQCCDVTIAQNVDEAVQLLSRQSFDGVFLGQADLVPLRKVAVPQQAVHILNTLGEGVGLVGDDGTMLWANQQMEAFGPEVMQCVSQRSQRAFEAFQLQHKQDPDSKRPLRSRKYSFSLEPADRYFEMIVTAMLDDQDRLAQVACVVWEETASRRLQQRINAIDKAGRELVRLDAESFGGLTVEQRINLVQEKVIRYARDLLHFNHFVVRILNRQSNELEVLFGVGLQEDEQTEVFANIQNNGITGYVAATGRSYICNDPESDPRYLKGLDGARCSMTVPLRLHDKIIGTLNVESDKERAFGEDDRQMAEIFGRYIAVALNILDLLVVERYQTTGQTADSFCQQVSEPLSELMTQASLILEDYIGHDDIRHRVQALIERITKIKEAMRDVHSAPKGLLGSPRVGVSFENELAGKQILLVDDEQFIRETIAGIVQKHGCIVDTARDGREAQALLAQKTYDLVLSDIKLPYSNGYEVFAAARRLHDHVPVILMTGFGYDPNHSIVRANKEGLSAILYKPFKVEQLMTEIRQALAVKK